MKDILVLLLFSATVATSFGQQRTTDGRVNFIASNDRFQYVNPFDERQISTRGTRYLLDSFYRPGELQTSKQLYTTELLYRFDQIERTVQVRLENGKEMFLRENDVIYFKMFFGERQVHFINATVPNGRNKTLVQVIYQSPTMQLLRDSRKYLFRVKSESLDGYSSDEIYDDVRKDYRYFIKTGEHKPFKEVKPDAKSFLKVMPEKKMLITKLFRAAETKEGVTLTELSDIMRELDKKAEVTQ